MKRVLGNIVFVFYVAIAVFVTICLLSFNDYKVSEFGDTSLLIIDSNQVEPYFEKGDLAIINKNDSIEEGDAIFFYNTYSPDMQITIAEVTEIEEITPFEYTYTLNGDTPISSEYVIGSVNTAKRMPIVGAVLGALESQWGFLFLIVFPSLVAFLYEAYIVVQEVRELKKLEKTEEEAK